MVLTLMAVTRVELQ